MSLYKTIDQCHYSPMFAFINPRSLSSIYFTLKKLIIFNTTNINEHTLLLYWCMLSCLIGHGVSKFQSYPYKLNFTCCTLSYCTTVMNAIWRIQIEIFLVSVGYDWIVSFVRIHICNCASQKSYSLSGKTKKKNKPTNV